MWGHIMDLSSQGHCICHIYLSHLFVTFICHIVLLNTVTGLEINLMNLLCGHIDIFMSIYEWMPAINRHFHCVVEVQLWVDAINRHFHCVVEVFSHQSLKNIIKRLINLSEQVLPSTSRHWLLFIQINFNEVRNGVHYWVWRLLTAMYHVYGANERTFAMN